MAAITPEITHRLAEIIHPIQTRNLLVVGLVAWVAVGWILFICYGSYVNNLAWAELSAVSPVEADTIKADYYARVVVICFSGVIAWIAGMVVLAALALRGRAHRW